MLPRIHGSRESPGLLATFDAVISDSAKHFLQSLNEIDRREFYRALDVLLANPHPDGASKVSLDFYPYPPGVIGATSGEFRITYTFLNATTLEVTSVAWSPDSPRRQGELFEI